MTAKDAFRASVKAVLPAREDTERPDDELLDLLARLRPYILERTHTLREDPCPCTICSDLRGLEAILDRARPVRDIEQEPER